MIAGARDDSTWGGGTICLTVSRATKDLAVLTHHPCNSASITEQAVSLDPIPAPELGDPRPHTGRRTALRRSHESPTTRSGIVKLSRIGLTDPQHARFTT